ncbi:hypothetical protein SAMN05192565_107188 [Methylobacterium gossipiicola]|uniref:Uncharacterized protein n=1 Tax=Methylobacterium gossipiicola TaxID=582675 RepID=A0A1I2TLB9_9HYPH|nr:hypothetical protein SAMN05192565_107188 [Methylobacterium gossipiicola]
MDAAELYSRAPYRIRFGTCATIEDRHGAGAFMVIEPADNPAERIAFAEAWIAQVNAAAAQAEPSALPVAAE